ncbi:16S rRNA (cytosine(1402)-N(4))-methyltransferase RsmH [Candidatus Peregrinibacteria bacterium]|nr:16S rRNA (cytosine(1402)-N(4))-methyltransferase RsmH [Candidatus Peregrinibacteria bacterium]
MNDIHIPVLTNKILEYLEPVKNKIFIDCTLGSGGHAEALITHGAEAVYGIEVDERNLEKAKERLKQYENVHFIHDNFENLETIGAKILKKEKRIHGILFDLGLSSLHVDEAVRGFSFQHEGPLDMRFDTRTEVTAADIVNTYTLEELLFIFKTYGEEKSSYRIAREIVQHRRQHKFATTSQLADFIANIFSKGKPNFYFKRHPATRIFQALRIAANREIEVLQKGLEGAVKVLSITGKLVVISYHSLEDRLVKNFFRHQKTLGSLKILTKKPITPDDEEINRNRRSRSAKLRAAEKL